ncbi:MAG: YtxH domain-containing protein [Bacteroidales bacterium]|jgi:gas vesicle protein|nr:YtxH domain-containing protein [Bacteroidales bacterium]
MDSGKILLGFLSGAAVGVIVGMLYAPHKGSVTRRKIIKTAKDFKDNIEDKFKNLAEKAEEFVEEIKDVAKDISLAAEDEE